MVDLQSTITSRTRRRTIPALDAIDKYDSELEQMNKDKVEEPFHYPNTLLLLLGYAKAYFHSPYRQTEVSIAKESTCQRKFLHQSNIILHNKHRRINRLNIKVEDASSEESKDNYVIVALDNTNIKITNRGLGG